MAISATLALGLFVFGMSTADYNKLRHKIGWRHASNSRVGARPSSQFVGPDAETIELNGTLLPEITGNLSSLDTLRYMASTGQSWLLLDGTGSLLGTYAIEDIGHDRQHLFQDGAPRQVDFDMRLRRVDHDSVDQIGNVVQSGRAAIGAASGLAGMIL